MNFRTTKNIINVIGLLQTLNLTFNASSMIYFKTLIHELHGSKMAINIYNDAFRFTVHNAYLKFKKTSLNNILNIKF